MIKAFTYRVSSEEEINTIKRLTKGTLDLEVQIYNIPQYSPEKILEDGDVALSFGTTATLAVRDVAESKKLAIQFLSLPTPKSLTNREGNEAFREAAWGTLVALKGKVESKVYEPAGIAFTEQDLPDLDRRHLLVLEKLLSKSNGKFCIQASKNGKTIAIGDIIPIDFRADIKISFEELYTIRSVMDILGLSDVTLINLN